MAPCPGCKGSGLTPGGSWFRPGPLFESRALGRWPSAGTYGVWSDSLFGAAEAFSPDFPAWHILPELGCDPARFGDDFTAIHVRWGAASVHHERHNGWALDRTAGRLKQLCRLWAGRANAVRPDSVPRVLDTDVVVKVDCDGLGAGVIDMAAGYSFVGVSGAQQARQPADYPNLRSQLWFSAADLAEKGGLGLGRLDQATRTLLRRQALAPTWKVDSAGRCLVEPKDQTKKRLGGSPDDMDAFNLAYWVAGPFRRPPVVEDPKPLAGPREGGEAERLGLFGLGGRR